ncbi:hypothetical protein ACA910_001236 [Epithemia clementina (nom. ined.)]
MVLLLITYAVMGRDHNDDRRGCSSGSGEGAAALMEREISWHNFLQLFQQQDVVKIAMSDERNRASIYLRSNAVEFSSGGSCSTLPPPYLMMTNHPAASSSSYERRRRRQQQQQQSSRE